MTEPVVYLVDDDQSVLKAVSRLLRAEGFDTRPFANPNSFLSQHDPNLPGCIILDVAMPQLSGLDLQELITAAGHKKPVIFISGKSDLPTGVSAMKHGAVDFIVKPFDDHSLIVAVKKAIKKDQTTRKSGTELASINSRLSKLTPREKSVFNQVVLGKLNKQIAASLGIVEKTVKVHRGRMMKKMGVRTLAQLIHLSERLGASKSS